MNCPHCGKWNRDALPRCFYCGAVIKTDSSGSKNLRNEAIENSEKTKSYIRYDEYGDPSSVTDARDDLAREMRRLRSRKQKGRIEQHRFIQEGIRQGITPPSEGINSRFDRYRSQNENNRPVYRTQFSEDDSMNLQEDGAAMEVEAQRYMRTLRGVQPNKIEQIRLSRTYGLHRIFKVLSIILCVLAVLLAGYRYGLPLVMKNTEVIETEQVEIMPSILDDAPAHTIKIPESEGALIYIKELRKTYTVTGGYATIEVADYTWYENIETANTETVTATLTPYLKSSAGEQVPMKPISFEVSVPESPIILVSPDTGYAEVTTAYYNIQFKVEKNSIVTIDGKDYSDLVNVDDGLISYNASISPIGNNEIRITVKSQYYREATKTITIFREYQEIPLDLSSMLNNRSISQTMSISATTLPGATITIKSDYVNLDTSQLNSKGIFSFEAVFTRIGTNTIEIQADYPGKQPSVVTYDVYYLPESRIYTAKAWPLDSAWDYSDLLSNISTRIANGQIYRCIGTITTIISDNPQLAIMEMGTEEVSRTVLLENRSTDTWVVGQRYRVYADVYGLYNSMPRLIGRYTYAPLK